MDFPFVLNELERNAGVYRSLFSGVTQEQYLWKSAPDKWCLLEILCHLVDEEREDFRARTKHALETPTEQMPSIDPQSWITSRDYIHKDYNQKLEQLLHERNQSIEWLKNLSNPQWDSAYLHPKFGEMKAELFLTNWLAHDYLHIRQILKLKFDYLNQSTDEGLDYAGNW